MRVRIKGVPEEVTGFLVSMEHNGATLAGGYPLPLYDVIVRSDKDPRVTASIKAVPDDCIEFLERQDESTTKEECPHAV